MRAVLGGGHEPRAGIIGHASLRPLLEGDHERILREILCLANVPHHAREACDHLRRLDSPDRVDRAVDFRERHGLQSRERATPVQARATSLPRRPSISSSRVGHTSIVASGALGNRDAIPIASRMSAASIR